LGINLGTSPVASAAARVEAASVGLRRWTTSRRSRPAVPGGQPELCDVCAAVTTDGTEQYATVQDSSAVDLSGRSSSDGQRRIVACGPTHLQEMIRHYQNRPYDEEELWAHILTRAQRHTVGDTELEDLVYTTGLTMVQLMRAARWQSIWLQWLPPSNRPDR
jgi:hypothetical protein